MKWKWKEEVWSQIKKVSRKEQKQINSQQTNEDGPLAQHVAFELKF